MMFDTEDTLREIANKKYEDCVRDLLRREEELKKKKITVAEAYYQLLLGFVEGVLYAGIISQRDADEMNRRAKDEYFETKRRQEI